MIIKTDEVEPIILPPPTPPENPPPPIKPLIPNEVPNDTPIEEEPNIPNLELDDFVYQLPEKPKEANNEDEIVDLGGLEILPTMIGGLEALYAQIRYPEMAQKAGIEGTVTVLFVVNKNGDVENPEIIRPIGGGCDEEVLRVIKEIRFSPGVQNGNIVKVRMAQSVRFRLQN